MQLNICLRRSGNGCTSSYLLRGPATLMELLPLLHPIPTRTDSRMKGKRTEATIAAMVGVGGTGRSYHLEPWIQPCVFPTRFRDLMGLFRRPLVLHHSSQSRHSLLSLLDVSVVVVAQHSGSLASGVLA